MGLGQMRIRIFYLPTFQCSAFLDRGCVCHILKGNAEFALLLME